MLGFEIAMAEATSPLEMHFHMKKMSESIPEYSSVWNPYAQEAMIRMVIVPVGQDGPLKEKPFNLESAESVQLALPADPELLKACPQVARWSFEYTPSMSEFLMYAVIRGEGCEKVSRKLLSLPAKWTFKGVSDVFFLPTDIVLNVQP